LHAGNDEDRYDMMWNKWQTKWDMARDWGRIKQWRCW